MFAAIAARYDLFNAVNSLGTHGRWRRALVRASGATGADRILDCATGTGDVAIEFSRALGPAARITGIDFCPEMLDLARSKAAREGRAIDFREADLLRLPFPDASFDVVSIAFGIRNVPDLATAVREMARVLKPGGRLLVLEFGRPTNRIARRAVEVYLRWFVNGLSGRFTGNAEAYRYLTDSTGRFNTGERLLEACRESGRFGSSEVRPLSLGMVYLYRFTAA
jgi:demethylmenaquinone methyltransferase/2-methoxy-6-polyprenyl-1,4-benzoquinol methylase